MMTSAELREIVQKSPKYPGTKHVTAASVCNAGFPGTFNLSFTEAEMIELYGQYLDYNEDLMYSKIQPVIRHNDWSTIEGDPKNRYRYLGVFDMADIAGAITGS